MTANTTLLDGSRVPYELVTSTFGYLSELRNTNPEALWILVMKCKGVSYTLQKGSGDPDPYSTLQTCKLLDKNQTVPKDIQKIVLNAVEPIVDHLGKMQGLYLRNPLALRSNAHTASLCNWDWCVIL